MFRKPFNVKSKQQLSKQQRKQFIERCHDAIFTICQVDVRTSAEAHRLETFVAHLATRNWHCCLIQSTPPTTQQPTAPQCVRVYMCGDDPYLFECSVSRSSSYRNSTRLIPSIYLSQQLVPLLPTVATHADVLPRLRTGADLMAPGVLCVSRLCAVQDSCVGVTLDSAGTTQSTAVYAVGVTLIPSVAMCGGRGRAVRILHCREDHLWNMGTRRISALFNGLHTESTQSNTAPQTEVTQNATGLYKEALQNSTGFQTEVTQSDTGLHKETTASLDTLVTTQLTLDDPSDTSVRMDARIMDAFVCACLTHNPKLPILVSTFYANHMKPCASQPIEFAKSSYRKLIGFLHRVQTEGVLVVSDAGCQTGVHRILSIDRKHPLFTSSARHVAAVSVASSPPPPAVVPTDTDARFVRVTKMYVVTARCVPLFTQCKPGVYLTSDGVRRHVTEYVRRHQLAGDTTVTLDHTLAAVLGARAGVSVTWCELHTRCLEAMSPGYSMTFASPDTPAVETCSCHRGEVPSVQLRVQRRAGNKLVTLISGLPLFRVDCGQFAAHLRVGVGASVCVTDQLGGAGCCVIVQGNQVKFVADLLHRRYNISNKHVTGLELASKESKSQRQKSAVAR